MCGIAGIAGPAPLQNPQKRLGEMLSRIVHRGPDDEGSWVGTHAALGMRRLSIIDLSGGHQPMVAENGTVIVFNGEIYNFKSLRETLEKDGYVFKTNSDTEVILALYCREGIGAIEKLNGMFAIAIYDPALEKLHLVRDRVGIKPLYYCLEDGFICFASELKALLAGLQHKSEVNQQAIWHYLSLRFVPAPETMWQGVYKLLPGHRIEMGLKDGSFEIVRYWQTQFISAPLDPARDYEGGFEKLFLDAVQARILAADVPVGVLLSGGLDSSAVAAAISELGHKNLNSYNIVFEEGGDFSESEFAKQTAGRFDLNHHEVTINRDGFMQTFEELPYMSDEPLADLASVPLYHICREARKDVTVVLAGEGADETLAGYRLQQAAQWLAQMKSVSVVPKPLLKMLSGVLGKKTLSILAEHGWENLYRQLGRHMTSNFSDEEKTAMWKGDAGLSSSRHEIERWYAEAKSAHPIDQWQQVHFQEWLVEDLLMKADKMSMATSLELRVPFLDHRMVEFAATLPMEWKVGSKQAGWTTKRILREFAAKRLPESVIKRPKQGFPVPCYQWLQDDEFYKDVQSKMTRDSARLKGFVDPARMEETLAKSHQGDKQAAHKVWNLMVLDQWMEKWL